MKTFKQVIAKFPFLPAWYCEQFHTGLVTILEQQGKLHGCKAIRSASNAEIEANKSAKEILLFEAKELCDYIIDGVTLSDNERLAKQFGTWAWGKVIPSEITALEEFVLRFLNEKNIDIQIVR